MLGSYRPIFMLILLSGWMNIFAIDTCQPITITCDTGKKNYQGKMIIERKDVVFAGDSQVFREDKKGLVEASAGIYGLGLNFGYFFNPDQILQLSYVFQNSIAGKTQYLNIGLRQFMTD